MRIDSKAKMVNSLDKVHMSDRERARAKGYVQKVEDVLDFIWPTAAKASSAVTGGAGRSAKAGKEWKTGSA